MFVCGDDAGAKATVVDLLESFGWSRERIVDLGGIAASRAREMYLPLWLTLFRTFGTPHVNVRVALTGARARASAARVTISRAGKGRGAWRSSCSYS